MEETKTSLETAKEIIADIEKRTKPDENLYAVAAVIDMESKMVATLTDGTPESTAALIIGLMRSNEEAAAIIINLIKRSAIEINPVRGFHKRIKKSTATLLGDIITARVQAKKNAKNESNERN
jgi:hypothetical protein